MFGKKHQNDNIDSLIGAGFEIDGDITFVGGLRIDGRVIGNVHGAKDKTCTLFLSENAKVEGEIDVVRAQINGTVVGPIRATGHLEFLPKANVSGDVRYKSIEIHVGAVIEGRLVSEAEKAEKVVEIKPPTGG